MSCNKKCGECECGSKAEKIGGPSYSNEKCLACGEIFRCYRAGSHDWQPKQCPSCSAKKFAEMISGTKGTFDV